MDKDSSLVRYYILYVGIKYSITPIIRTLVTRISNYPDRLGPSGNFDENSTKRICLEIGGYRIEYSAVKCYGCLELKIRRGRKVHTVNSNSCSSQIRQGTPNCQIHIRNYVLMFYVYLKKYVAKNSRLYNFFPH
jgi:hypothetical protein